LNTILLPHIDDYFTHSRSLIVDQRGAICLHINALLFTNKTLHHTFFPHQTPIPFAEGKHSAYKNVTSKYTRNVCGGDL